MKQIRILVLGTAILALGACSFTQTAKTFNGVSTPDGTPQSYQVTTNYALHLLFGARPLLGDASVQKTVDDFTASAKKAGASKFRIADRSCTSYWIILPPFSFILTPVICEVGGDLYR